MASSATPLLLINEQLVVQAASDTFCRGFDLAAEKVVGTQFLALGNGEWNKPQLRSLLEATASGRADIDAYEFALKRKGNPDRALILHAHTLDELSDDHLWLVVAILDITVIRDAELALRAARQENEALVREKQVLLQEQNHRVANSLQIIASILMQRVRSVQSEEARNHLQDAHHRVMSVATLQRLLASTASGEVQLRPYLTELCASIGASMIANPDNLMLNVSADDTVMSSDRSTSLGLIITELVINALKHAFPNVAQQHCHIDVSFAASPSGWVLTVSDNGCGLPDNHADAKPGLGTGIVNALAGQLGATVDLTDNNPGTRVTIACAPTEVAEPSSRAV